MIKNIIRTFRRSNLVTFVNIIGLTIGLAVSIMLLLFVLYERSYDKHFKDLDRIVSLNTVLTQHGEVEQLPICTRGALTEVPEMVSGIEHAALVYSIRDNIAIDNEVFKNKSLFLTQSSFIDIFSLNMVAGDKTGLDNPMGVIVTDELAELMFGSAQNAIEQKIIYNGIGFTIYGVVEKLPANTHFNFDALVNFGDMISIPSIEFFAFYKLGEGVPFEETAKAIEERYATIVTNFLGKGNFALEVGASVEKLSDIYLHTKSGFTMGTMGDLRALWLFGAIAIMILALAITNFVNLYVAYGERRIIEIALRKVNGASRTNISMLFLIEVTAMILMAFVLAMLLAIALTPQFSTLINRPIDISLLNTPILYISILVLFIVTAGSAFLYPAQYLGKFSPMDIINKRIKFSQNRLNSVITTFQSIVTIVLIAFILIISDQTTYLKDVPMGYNPENIAAITTSRKLLESGNSFREELLENPSILSVSYAGHYIGGGASGQSIKRVGAANAEPVNEYRVSPGISDMMEFEFIEGGDFKRDDPKNENSIILNEAAVKMLGLEYPVTEVADVEYKGVARSVIGVVKDFQYSNPGDIVQPIVLSCYGSNKSVTYIKFDEHLSRKNANEMILRVAKDIDPDYSYSPLWLEDTYNRKFDSLNTNAKVMFWAFALALIISMLGLFAIHSLSAIRRRKEIALRRINGANKMQIFTLLTGNMIKLILVAGVIAIPVVWWVAKEWLANYPNRVGISLWIFIIPIIIQIAIALITISGITWQVASQNPVDSIKSE